MPWREANDLVGRIGGWQAYAREGQGGPSATGTGPWVRRDQARGDYKDPGWYKHPAGTNAFEWTGAMPEPARFAAEGKGSMPPSRRQSPKEIEVQIRKPGAGSPQHKH
jgi:hypothetical protein